MSEDDQTSPAISGQNSSEDEPSDVIEDAGLDIQISNSPAAEVPYPRLEMRLGPEEGLIVPINQDEIVIGRSPKRVSLKLDDTSLSRVHATEQTHSQKHSNNLFSQRTVFL